MTDQVKTIEGNVVANGRRFAIVCSRFNNFIVDRLVEGAIDTIVRHGGKRGDITVIKTPGSFELPMLAQMAAKSGKYDAVIVCGALIRGATPHFDYIAAEATKGVARVALDSDIPVTFGVLTCNTIEQAIERAGTKAGNKGVDAALSAIEMVDLYNNL
jgi:6,7-dimethyl-8-ribityllumazine synthase